ncbi:hypothetical protein WH43_14350 [Rheinheimera sp. KL1]|uniref:hypothetical protein n=1 Tax=Rheinheimera sp. KL1 TaxID=1635005 RepID=UPI0006A96539|nr:hypothetical protein [Rheinheimera sp. KL1]KOO57269.1 hypothetical protein WH43_14350 [Rheinheimera sp. KL1]
MSLSDKEEFILFQLNPGAYGSAHALTAVHAIPAADLNYSPELQTEQTNESKGFDGASVSKIVGGYQQITFKCYLRGSPDGEPDTPPVYGPLLRAAGHREDITLTEVTYSPVSENLEHATLWYYVGGANGVLHKLTGVRMSCKFVAKVGALAYWEFTAMGLDNEPVPAGAYPEVDWSGLTIPLHTAANNVETMTLFGAPVGMSTMTITPGFTVGHMHVTNQEEIVKTDVVGSVDISIVEPDPTTINYWSKAKKGDQGPLAFQQGKPGSVGEIFSVNIPNLQLATAPSRQKRDGRLYLDLKLDIVPLTKNSGHTFVTK